MVLPTKERRVSHLGQFWNTDTPEQRRAVLEGGHKIPSKDQVIYLGCTLNFASGALVPHDVDEIRRDTQHQMDRMRLAPAAALMGIDSKVPSRWYTVASVYQPTAEQHESTDKLLLRIFKMITGLSRYAKTQPTWAPQKDSGMGLVNATARFAVAVQREWVRHYGGCRQYYREGLVEYLKVIHRHYGECPAVLLPHQRDLRVGPHVWACLQQVVPMWLPGTCHKKGQILVKHRANRKGDMVDPEELIWETEYGPVLAVKVPHNVFNTAVKIEVHHLEDLVEKDGDATSTTHGFRNMGATPYQDEAF